jgi:hypothetical protein
MCQNNILKQFVEVGLKVEQGYFFHHLYAFFSDPTLRR